MPTVIGSWERSNLEPRDMRGPYQCPHCSFRAMFNATFLGRTVTRTACPNCKRVSELPLEYEWEDKTGERIA